jgi:hypothetical protein
MDIEHTHIAAAGTVKALCVAASVAAAVAAGAGPNVNIAALKGTAMIILDVGIATAGSSESLQATLYESDDQSTWTAVPNVTWSAVTTTASLQTASIRPGERKKWLSMGFADTGSGAWPVSAHILYLS